MKHNFNDNTFPAIGVNIPAEISIYRADQCNSFQDACEGGAVYHINKLTDIFDITLEHFNLTNAVTIQSMFGESSMTYAIHDDSQLFMEVEAEELTALFLEEYRLSLVKHIQDIDAKENLEELKDVEYRATILGWNSIHGGSFAVNYTYPATFTEEELDEATTAFIQDISRDHAEDEVGSEDFLFITHILSGHQADDFKPFGHTEGHDQYNFPQMPKWEYKLLCGSVLWCGGDYGTVEAHTESAALELAREELATHFTEVNKRLQGFDTFEFSDDDIEVMAV